jgi:DNA-binding LacI/PurR family transcriptional regulator
MNSKTRSENRMGEQQAGPTRLQMSDLANMAGVSVATVSRALNDSPLVNAETRERIQTLASKLNYTINLSARNLRLQNNNTVAVVVPFDANARQHISDPFFLSIVGSLADVLTEQGYDMLLSRVNADQLGSAASLVDTGRAKGLIIIGQWRRHDQLNALADRNIPLVVWGAEVAKQRYCTVGGNNQLGGRLAASHLIKLGRKRLVFLGDADLPEVFMRKQGFDQAVADGKLKIKQQIEVPIPFDGPAAYSAIARLCQQGVDFDGVVACSDVLALQAIRAIQDAGKLVPKDVAVVGYDDTPMAVFGNPPLSSIHQPVAEAGIALVQALVKHFGPTAPSSITLPVHLVARQSTDPAQSGNQNHSYRP